MELLEDGVFFELTLIRKTGYSLLKGDKDVMYAANRGESSPDV